MLLVPTWFVLSYLPISFVRRRNRMDVGSMVVPFHRKGVPSRQL